MNIEFISTSRYPTQKAYGVTIGNSCMAARNLGFNAQITGISSCGLDEYGNQVNLISSRLSSTLFYIVRKNLNRSISRLAFNLLSINIGFLIFRRFRSRQNDLIWLRNILTTFTLVLLHNQNNKVLEIHHIPNSLNKFLLGKLISRKDVRIFTITERHRARLQELFPKGKIGLAPMATPRDFFANTKNPNLESSIKIGYVGKFMSSGHDNGLLDFLKSATRIQLSQSEISLKIIGIEQDKLPILNGFLSKEVFGGISIQVVGAVPHSQIQNFLLGIDIGVIPYQQSAYNDNRFPIKVLEYASTKCLILVSDIEAHRAILDETKAVFFNPGNPDSLKEAISWISDNQANCLNRIQNAFEWSKGYSYEDRVSRVIQNVG
jgi:glycosyltransferase involved in cell wall biosynthesis